MFELKVGAISRVLKVKDGFLIFRIEDKAPERVLSFQEAKEQVVTQLRQEKELARLKTTEKELFFKYGVTFKGGYRPVSVMQEQEAAIVGKIISVTPAETKARNEGTLGNILIESKTRGAQLEKASVRVTAKTHIYRKSGENRENAGFDDLRAGQEAEVWFAGPVLASDPVQAEAKEILIR